MSARVSIAWKLPLLMTAIFATGLAAVLGWTYVTLASRAEVIVRDRLVHSVRQIASDAATSLDGLAATFRSVADSAPVRRAVVAAGAGRPTPTELAAARTALAGLAARDTTHAVEVWDATGRPLASVGTLPADVERPPVPASDAPTFTPIRVLHGQPVFWVVAPIVADGQRVGYVAQPRRVGGPRSALVMLHEYLREEFTLHTRNADGSVWTVAPSGLVDAPVRREMTKAGLVYVRRDSSRDVAEEAPVRGTPWVMVIASPQRWIASRPVHTIRTLSLICLPLLALGAIVTWLAGRRIARPLSALTQAAEAVALGTYERRVATGPADEIGRLTASFDAMARQVGAAQRELERRVRDAQASAAEVERVNQQLRLAVDEADRANRAKADFLAVMSHELRTPLNAIGGYAELIEMGIHGPVTDAQRDALLRIGRSQAHLLTLIDGVLSFARIDAGQVQYAIDDVSMHDTLAGLEALVAPQLRSRQLALSYEPCATTIAARADRDKLAQVVLNLLGNAIKYTPAGGTIVLGCDADEQHVHVRVRDRGPGIPAERLRAIFEPFVQGNRALNRPHEGVGLGLAISRDLARGMHGDVSVASTLEQGSTFTLTLPRAHDLAVAASRHPLGSVDRDPARAAG